MAEKRSSEKVRKCTRKSPGKVQFSDLNSEDAAKRRAALENAIRKKIETEKRALQIVERLLEDDITEDFLMDCARFISPSYYKDVVEERSIIMLCGYPICNKKLENVPKQKYKISTKTNKVYDITERKCFCSNFCYRASKYYEAQIPKTPVWSREEESPPVIKLLKEGRSGSSGEEVILTERRIKISEVEKPKRTTENGESSSANSDEEGESEQAFVSSVIPEQSHTDTESPQGGANITREEKTPDMAAVDQKVADAAERLTHCSLRDHEKKTSDPQRDEDARPGSEVTPSSGTHGVTSDLQRDEDARVGSEDTSSSGTHGVTSDPQRDEDARPGSKVTPSSGAGGVITEVTRRAVSKSGAEHLRKLLSKSKSHRVTQPASIPPIAVKRTMLDVLTQTLNEWRSEETVKYLFGTDYVVEPKEPIAVTNQRPDLDEDDLFLDDDDIEFPSDSATVLNESLPFGSKNSDKKPLPNYTKLREETKDLEIRVREFYRGHYVLPEEVGQDEQRESKEVTSWAPPLPLVDSCSQQQVRKRIVLEKLKKVLPALLIPLQITYSDVSKELHDLVRTFRFTNTNIAHTVPEWSIVAIVLLSVLLPTMPLHKDSEQNPLYTQFVSKLLEELHFQQEDLECLKRNFGSRTISQSSM